MNKALICGISGQDGSYLAKFLLKKGYKVFGTSRSASSSSYNNLKLLGIDNSVEIISVSLNDLKAVIKLIENIAPNEIYNLSGPSSVSFSYENPEEAIKSLVLGTLNLLEAIRLVSNKIRLEDSKLSFGGLSVDKRAELSAYDLAALDSNKLGIFFSPTDVINEDIIRSVANLDFDQYIGDPRDKYKYRYRQLEDVATTYWQKYNSPNNFWDYIRLIRYYDSSLFEQLRKFVPARARASVGLLIEPNILERKKEVVGKKPTFEDLDMRGAVNLFVQSASAEILPLSASVTSHLPIVSGSYPTYEGSASIFDTVIVTGSYDYYEGETTSSMWRESLYILSSSAAGWGGGEERWGDAKITIGGPEKIFGETLQPNISSSVLSEHNYEYRFFYTNQTSASADHGYVWDTERSNYQSRSLVRSEVQSVGYDNSYFRLAYGGCIQTKKSTLDLESPVSIVITSPTTLVTQDPGESKLRVK